MEWRRDGQTDGQSENNIPLQIRCVRGIKIRYGPIITRSTFPKMFSIDTPYVFSECEGLLWFQSLIHHTPLIPFVSCAIFSYITCIGSCNDEGRLYDKSISFVRYSSSQTDIIWSDIYSALFNLHHGSLTSWLGTSAIEFDLWSQVWERDR